MVCLPFGPTSSPRVFTKIVTVLAAHFRVHNVRLATYLDDWFVVDQNKQMLLVDREKVLNLLLNMGFIINLEKSALTPTQNPVVHRGLVQATKGGSNAKHSTKSKK